MKVILLKDVSKLGKKYDVKDVSDGHALNLLIPHGSAVAATPDALKRLEKERSKIEVERKVQGELFAKNLDNLSTITLNIISKANDKGHLFAGLHRDEVAKEIEKQTRLRIDPALIQLDHPIKEVGEHLVGISGEGKSIKMKVMISKQ